MSLFNDYYNSHFSDRNYKDGDFVLSSLCKRDLEKYNINMKVRDFKNYVKKSRNYKTILTGGGLNYRRTKVYNFYDFQNLKNK